MRELKTIKIIEEKDSGFHDVFLDLVERLLEFDPKRRISSQEALNHGFLREGNGKAQL